MLLNLLSKFYCPKMNRRKWHVVLTSVSGYSIFLNACVPHKTTTQSDPDSIEGVKRFFQNILGRLEESDWALVRELRKNKAFLNAVKNPKLKGHFTLDLENLENAEKVAALEEVIRLSKNKPLFIDAASSSTFIHETSPTFELVGLSGNKEQILAWGERGQLTSWNVNEISALKLKAGFSYIDNELLANKARFNKRDIRHEIWTAPGQSLEISEYLGQGAAGQVYKGSLNGKEVAFKILNANSLGDKMALLIRNHELMQNFCVSHPQTCESSFSRVHGSGIFQEARAASKQTLLFTDLAQADGSALFQNLSLASHPSNAPIRVQALEQLYSHLASAVSELAVKGKLVHADIKPQNILLEEAPVLVGGAQGATASRFKVVISDFDGLSQPGIRSGIYAPLYASPEIFNGSSASKTSDYYSVGLTMAEYVLGRHPVYLCLEKLNKPTSESGELLRVYNFSPENHASLERILQEEFKRIKSTLPEESSEKFQAITDNILKLIAFSPEKRLEAATQLTPNREALSQVVQNSLEDAKKAGAH